MSNQEWIDPASCPPHKTYYGIVRTPSGAHERILQRSNKLGVLWRYYGSPEEGGPFYATDDNVSELIEIDPGTFRSLRQDVKNLQDELDRAEDELEWFKYPTRGRLVTEERVREIVREELNDDLIPRLEKAVKAIEKLRDEQAWSDHEKVRLEGKREGVQLALSYAREGLRS